MILSLALDWNRVILLKYLTKFVKIITLINVGAPDKISNMGIDRILLIKNVSDFNSNRFN